MLVIFMNQKSIQRELFVQMIALAVIPIIIVGILSIVYTSDVVETYASNANKVVSKNLLNQIDLYLEEQEKYTVYIQKKVNAEIESGIEKNVLEFLSEEMMRQNVMRIELVDELQRIVEVYPQNNRILNLDVSGRIHNGRVQFNEGIVWTNMFVDFAHENQLSLAMTTNLRNGYRLYVMPDLKKVEEIIGEANFTENSFVAVMDPTGTYIAHTNKKYADYIYVDPNYYKLLNLPEATHGETIQYLGKNFWPMMHKTLLADWAVIVYQSEEDIEAMIARVGLVYVLITVIPVGAIILFSIYRTVEFNHSFNELRSIIEHFMKRDINGLPDMMKHEEFEITRLALLDLYADVVKREKEIMDLNESLEEKVELRTQELNEANMELEASIDTLQKTQDQLVEAQKLAELSRLVTGVAHEMNTPLGNAITSNSYAERNLSQLISMIENNKLTRAKLMEFVNTIKDALNLSQRELGKNAQLIDLFKETGIETSVEFKTIELNKCLDEMIGEIKKQHKGIVVTWEPIKNKTVNIKTDESMFKNMIYELVRNSVIHAYEINEKKKVEIRLLEHEERAIIEIIDYGKGISIAVQKEMYKPFFTTRPTTKNTGLGLFRIKNQAINLLDIEMECDSKVNSGTIFRLKLPYK